jgi:hypothetical protein
LGVNVVYFWYERFFAMKSMHNTLTAFTFHAFDTIIRGTWFNVCLFFRAPLAHNLQVFELIIGHGKDVIHIDTVCLSYTCRANPTVAFVALVQREGGIVVTIAVAIDAHLTLLIAFAFAVEILSFMNELARRTYCSFQRRDICRTSFTSTISTEKSQPTTT